MSVKRWIPVLVLALAAGCAGDGKKTPTQHEAAQLQWNGARAGVLYGLAKQQFETGNLPDARKSLDDALKLAPENLSVRLLSAKLNIEQGRLESAQRELQIALSIDATNAEADYLNGVICQRWQKLQQALEFYSSAAQKSPNELAYLLARSEMLVALDRMPEALGILQDKLAYFEDSAAIRDAAGQLLVQQGKYDEAAKLLRQACILAPDEIAIREHAALALYYAKSYAEAAGILEKLLKDEHYSNRDDLLLALAECQMHTGRPREARDNLQVAVQLRPGSIVAWLDLGKVAMELNDMPRAEMSLRRALAMEPRNSEVNLMFGYLRLRQGRLDQALAAFRESSALDAKDPLSLCMCGYVLEKQGRAADAVGYYSRALKLKPGDDLAATLLAQVQMAE